MRPGQNKRMRGRNNNNNSSNNNRKGPNPLTRSYESNGPDVKIRGTAHHIGEKYLQLARDAQSSGDPVMAESYLQHAEHYFRLIASAQQAQQQAQFGYQRQPGDQTEADEEDGDEDFVSVPDRFASPAERVPQPVQQVPQPYAERGPYSDRAPYEPRQEARQEPRQDRAVQDRQGQDRQGQDRQYQDRQYQDRQNQDRAYEPRQAQTSDRQPSERPYDPRDRQYDNRRERQNYGERNNQDRSAPAAGNGERAAQDGPPRTGPERPPRDYDNRGYRNNRNREFRENLPREPRQPALEEPTNGLPAFITAPTRVVVENEPQPVVQEAAAPTPETDDESALHLRPRRRRRPKSEFAEGPGQTEAPATDPVGE